VRFQSRFAAIRLRDLGRREMTEKASDSRAREPNTTVAEEEYLSSHLPALALTLIVYALLAVTHCGWE
jgi:hypothetical protein